MDDDMVPLKVIVTNKNKSEIRYIQIDKYSNMYRSNDFKHVSDAIQAVFPILSDKQFNITWQDVDGDSVVISSDEELTLALSMMTSVKKLFVNILDVEHIAEASTQQSQLPPRETSKSLEDFILSFSDRGKRQLHFNIVCDACEGSVFGYRYKCLQCPDYDLCYKCEKTGHHRDHFMLRIPVTIPFIPFDLRGSKFGEWLEVNNCSFPHAEQRDKKHHKSSHRHNRKNSGQCKKRHINHEELMQKFTGYINDFTNLSGDIKMDLTGDLKENSKYLKKHMKVNQTNAKENTTADPTNSNENVPDQPCGDNLAPAISSIFGLIGNTVERVLNTLDIEIQNIPSTSQQPQPIPQEDMTSNQTKNPETESVNEEAMPEKNDNLKNPSASGTNDGAVKKISSIAEANPLLMKLINNNEMSSSAPLVQDGSDDSDDHEDIDDNDDSDASSDCMVINSPKENSNGWTILNADEPLVKVPKMDKKTNSVGKEVEAMVKEFQKHMDVSNSDVEKTPLSRTVMGAALSPDPSVGYPTPSTSNNETRFVLVDASTAIDLTLSSPTVPMSQSSVASTNTDHTTSDVSYQLPFNQPEQYNSAIPNSALIYPTLPPSSTPFHYNTPVMHPTHNHPIPVNPVSSFNPFYYTNPPQNPPQASVGPIHQQSILTNEHINPTAYRPKEPHFAAVLNQLLNMGYSNECGLLTDLIITHNGNINKILDILSIIKP